MYFVCVERSFYWLLWIAATIYALYQFAQVCQSDSHQYRMNALGLREGSLSKNLYDATDFEWQSFKTLYINYSSIVFIHFALSNVFIVSNQPHLNLGSCNRMYQIVGLINKFMYGSSQDAGQTVASWYNRREYADDNGSDDEETNAQTTIVDETEDPDFIPTYLKLVIILSGKRKSGKDHISTLITNYIGYQRMRQLAVLRIAGPIKKEFARNNKLDFGRLLDSSDYKENFRIGMVEWSERYREKEGWNCFLKQAIKEQKAKDKAIWILNDARRPCDLDYFENDPTYVDTKIIKLRIEASEEARISRGWNFVQGIDDRDTECGLDFYDDWTHVIENDYNDRKEILVEALQPIFEEIDIALAEMEN